MKQNCTQLVLGITLSLLFVLLSIIVRVAPETLTGFDDHFTALIQDRLQSLETLILLATQLASFAFTVIFTIAVSAVLFFLLKKRLEAFWFFAGVVLTGIFVQLIKVITARYRPSLEHLLAASETLSFPSRHTTSAMVMYGALIILIGIFMKNKMLMLCLQVLLSVVILAVGVSRIYVGVHFPSDVVGAFLLGGLWLCLSYVAMKKAPIRCLRKLQW